VALPNNPDLHGLRARFAAAEMRWAEADSITREISDRFRDNPTARLATLRYRSFLAELHGRFRELPALAKESHDLVKGLPNLQIAAALDLAETSLRIRGDVERGLRELENALRLVPLDSMPVGQRPFPRLAELYADAGRFDVAEEYIQKIVQRNPQRENAPGALNARAYIALLRGDGAPMLERRREAGPNCPPCNRHFVGRAYELLGHRDSALAAYETFLTVPHWTRLNPDLKWRPLVLVRAAELHEAAGNVARARELYLEFIRLWEQADPELQPRVEAAKRALARLTAERSG
jgi:tetratricopeptide (TPR) repeat protein